MTRIFVAAAVLVSLLQSPALAIAGEKIHPWLDKKLVDGKEMEFLVIMKESSDLSPAAHLKSKAEKGRFVHGELMRAAAGAQGPIREWLKSQGVSYRAFHIVNALLLKGDRKLMETLAARDDVERIEGNPEILVLPPLPEASPAIIASTTGIEWNVSQVGAPDLWVQGITGEGIVIGGADTGYRWTHDALKGKYRGWNGTTVDHNYNWHDAIHSGGGVCGPNAPAPCDDFGHGTHTMGTVVGDDGGGNQIGAAPGAKWIGCRNMNYGTGSPDTYLECFEFFLAPYPVGGTTAQGDPAKAPDLTVNSWHCPSSEGCSPLTLETAVNNMKAAGIMTVVSAGNTGPSCGSMTTPPAIYGSAYTVGAKNSDNTLASYSSRGPAGTTKLIKPDIVAPGSDIRSATYGSDSSYGSMSGTSMAAPLVAGGVALIWSAAPALKNNQDATVALLSASAQRLPSINDGCGGDYVNGPNNSWGYGLLDLDSAYDSKSFNLSVSLQGTGSGSVHSTAPDINCNSGTCNQSYPYGTVVALTPTNGAHSLFGGWSGDCSGSSVPCSVTMDAERTVLASFSINPDEAVWNDPGSNYFSGIYEAYQLATSGETEIKACRITFDGDVNFDLGKTVSLKGGYNSSYLDNSGVTTINGNVTLKSGSVTLANIAIK
jgi:subtilisin family serine protease